MMLDARRLEVSPPPLKRRKVTSNSKNMPPTGADSRTAGAVTLYGWNVNGVQPFIQHSIDTFFAVNNAVRRAPKAPLRDFLRRHNWPELLFLQEVKIRPGDTATMRAVEKSIVPRSDESPSAPHYLARFCLPSDGKNARGFGGKVYGVCCIIRRDFYDDAVSSVQPVEWDLEGRFLLVKTRAIRNLPQMAFINIYAVNGTSNPYKDPVTGAAIGTRHDRKLQVHKLLSMECQQLEAEGFAVVLAGDMNIARTAIDGHPSLRTSPEQHNINRADFEARFFTSAVPPSDKLLDPAARKAMEDINKATDDTPKATDDVQSAGTETVKGLEMIDSFRKLHPMKKGYTYYPRTCKFGESCDRVDMIMLSKSLGGNLVEAGMHETPIDRGTSDHVPLYVKLRFS